MVSLVQAPFTYKGVNTNHNATTTAAFTPAVGDIIVVKTVTEDNTIAPTAPTGTQGLSFSSQASVAAGGRCRTQLWTAPVVNAASTTVTHGGSAADGYRSSVVEWYTNAQLDATPAIYQGSFVSRGLPTATVSTEAANSIISWCDGDWSAVAGTITYNTTSATPDESLHDQDHAGANYCSYFATQTATNQGSNTIGMTSPTNQSWAMVAIEIQDGGGGTAWERNPSDDSAGLTDNIVLALSKVVTDNEGGTDWVEGLPEPPFTYTCSVVIG